MSTRIAISSFAAWFVVCAVAQAEESSFSRKGKGIGSRDSEGIFDKTPAHEKVVVPGGADAVTSQAAANVLRSGERVRKEEELLKRVRFTLSTQDVDVNAKNHRGQTRLHVAVENGYSKIVDYLLRMKANPEIRDSVGVTAIQQAKALKQPEVLAALKKHGFE